MIYQLLFLSSPFIRLIKSRITFNRTLKIGSLALFTVFALTITFLPIDQALASPSFLKINDPVILDINKTGQEYTIRYNLPKSIADQGSRTFFRFPYVSIEPESFGEIAYFEGPDLKTGTRQIVITIPTELNEGPIEVYQEVNSTTNFGSAELRSYLPNSRFNNLGDLLNVILTSAVVFRTGFFLVAVLVTGLMFIMAGSDAEKLKKARNNLGWLFAAMLLILTALILLSVMRDLVDRFFQTPSGLSPFTLFFSQITIG